MQRANLFTAYLTGCGCADARRWFFLDLIATIPFDLIVIGCGHACFVDDRVRWVLKWLRVARLCRLLRLGRILSRLEVRSGIKQTTSMAMHFIIGGLFCAHLSACCWYAIGRNDGTWVQAKNPQGTWSLVDAYVAALYWSFTTMSTIGYGDIGVPPSS